MRLYPLCLLLFTVCRAFGGAPLDEYYPYAEPEERMPLPVTDTTLFYRAVQTAPDLYSAQADFNLPQVAVRRRGQDFGAETATVSGLEIPYRYFTLLRALGAAETLFPGLGMTPLQAGAAGGVREFRFANAVPLQPYRASVRFSDRNYLLGARFSLDRELSSGWRIAAAADARTGRDMHVDGVFTNALTAGFRLAKRFKERHDLALLLIAPISARGTRLTATREAFELTGDPYYNPAWGFQNGKVRNSRVRRDAVPLGHLSFRTEISPVTTFAAALGVEAGVSTYSALGWYDARTPMPDNYRYLPSYVSDTETETAWRSNDTRYTQIDWDRLLAVNRMKGGEAAYTLEDRAERLCNLRFDAAFSTELIPGLTLDYGAFFTREHSRFYKRMRDLLGGEYLVDIDQYLVDDDTFGNLLQNDLRHPDRLIREGDRFGYDYALVRREAGLRVHAAWRADRFRADVAMRLGDAVVFRRGYYEKELFPGERSFGRSRRLHFTPWTLKALAGWAFSPRTYLGATVAAGAVAPREEDLFFQPLYNNRTVDGPTPERFYAAEVNFRRSGPVLDLQLTAFASAAFDRLQTRRYYDDLAGVYCDLSVTGIAIAAYGVEAAAEIRLVYRWRVSLALSAGRYKYIRDPRVTVLSDADNSLVDNSAVSRMGGCTPGGAPQLTACGGVNYFGPRGWGFRLSAGYAGARYVEPMPLRRTERIARQGGLTREDFEAFTRQERLRDAFTLDASLFKTIYFSRSQLTASLLLRNLLGSGDTVYNGYESLRVRRIAAGNETFRRPHATRYTCALPRSFFLTVSYRF